MGFEATKKYYFSERTMFKSSGTGLLREIYTLCKTVALAVPSFKRSLVVIARKTHAPSHDFWFTESNS